MPFAQVFFKTIKKKLTKSPLFLLYLFFLPLNGFRSSPQASLPSSYPSFNNVGTPHWWSNPTAKTWPQHQVQKWLCVRCRLVPRENLFRLSLLSLGSTVLPPSPPLDDNSSPPPSPASVNLSVVCRKQPTTTLNRTPTNIADIVDSPARSDVSRPSSPSLPFTWNYYWKWVWFYAPKEEEKRNWIWFLACTSLNIFTWMAEWCSSCSSIPTAYESKTPGAKINHHFPKYRITRSPDLHSTLTRWTQNKALKNLNKNKKRVTIPTNEALEWGRLYDVSILPINYTGVSGYYG